MFFRLKYVKKEDSGWKRFDLEFPEVAGSVGPELTPPLSGRAGGHVVDSGDSWGGRV